MSLRQMELVWVLALCGIAVAAWCLLRSGPPGGPGGMWGRP
ncbi:hypothetical protein [Kitasatospora albolonga]